ncbi:MAG: fumarate hydratase [Bradymonadales bacterium]|nr:fumarate hydratase [Bradymonadales bacterium]
MDLTEVFVELTRRCATDLAPDVCGAIQAAVEREVEGSTARSTLEAILANVEVARTTSTPICQDTGTPVLWVSYPSRFSQLELEHQMLAAIRKASALSYLRPNAVDAVSGKNSGDNTGILFPTFHFHQWERRELQVEMMLKGGGSENVSIQYSLPDSSLKAGRNLEGVRRCVVDAVFRAQGQGCAPGFIGVGIGANRDTGYEVAKRALMRPADHEHPNPDLAALERRLLEDLNQLEIGPMGFGGRTTALGVKVGFAHRLPACYFVSVAYTCWALRRNTVIVSDSEVSYDY